MSATEQTIATLDELGVPYTPTKAGILIPHVRPRVAGFVVDPERSVWRPKGERKAYPYRSLHTVLRRLDYAV